MSIENPEPEKPKKEISGAELGRMLDNGEWDKVMELIELSEEEVLREMQGPMIDGEDFNRMLGITEDEITEALASPSTEIRPPKKKGRNTP